LSLTHICEEQDGARTLQNAKDGNCQKCSTNR